MNFLSMLEGVGKAALMITALGVFITLGQLLFTLLHMAKAATVTLAPLEHTVQNLETILAHVEGIEKNISHTIEQFKKTLRQFHMLHSILHFFHFRKHKKRR